MGVMQTGQSVSMGRRGTCRVVQGAVVMRDGAARVVLVVLVWGGGVGGGVARAGAGVMG